MTGIEKAPDAWLVTFSDCDLPLSEKRVADLTTIHHAEPLYTLPNALRALIESGEIDGWRLDTEMGLSLALSNLAHHLEHPEQPAPPAPPEPTDTVHFLVNDIQYLVPAHRAARFAQATTPAERMYLTDTAVQRGRVLKNRHQGVGQ